MKGIKVPIIEKKDIYRYYVKFILYPQYSLTNRAIEVCSEILYYYDEAIQKGFDKDRASKYCLSYDRRRDICDNLDITVTTLNNNITFLRKKRIIIGKKINPSLALNKETHRNGILLKFDYATGS